MHANLLCIVISLFVSFSGSWHLKTGKPKYNVSLLKQNISNSSRHSLQLDFTLRKGLEAVRIMVLEGFNKGAAFANTPQPSQMLNK
uniref:Uncharacterized protein n=1 Tax=Arundo donax TaxID=35708 RepID=A0A0A9DMT2_ARUDO